MNREVYLDNSASTRPFDEVIDHMSYINKNIFGNPSSLHKKGSEAEKYIKKSREIIAESMRTSAKEIYFTSGGTESNNLAIRGYLNANPRKGKHILTTKIEHPSTMEVFKHLYDNGYDVEYIDVYGNGVIDLEALKKKIKYETALISIIYINNEIGTIQPIEEMVKIKNYYNKNTVIHIDAVQAYGKINIFPKKAGIDMLSISAHKIHGPKGVGALFIDKAVKISPIIYGGGQESSIRSGTENVAGICGFGLASEMIFKGLEENYKKVSMLKAMFKEKLNDTVKQYKVISPEDSSAYILNISFDKAPAEILLHHLEEKNIYVSTGSACSSRKNIQSHVLKAIGLESCDIDGAIRFSFSAENNIEDIEYTIKVLEDIVPKIRSIYGGKKWKK